MTPEQKMNALFAAEAVTARDVGFQVEVLARIARRRAWESVLSLLPWLFAVTAGLWGLQRAIGTAVDQLTPVLVPVAMTLTLVGGSLVAARWLALRFVRA